MNRNLALALVTASALGGAAIVALDSAEEAIAGITASTAPARPKLNGLAAVSVTVSPGACDATYEVRAGVTTHRTMVIQVRAGSGIGIRYDANGDPEGFTKTDPAITVGNCFGAFAGAAGGFGPKAAALEAWHQSVGLAPL